LTRTPARAKKRIKEIFRGTQTVSVVIALAKPRRIKASHRRRRRVASDHLLYILNNPLSGTDPTGYRSICPNGNCDSVTQVSSSTGDEKFQPAQTEAKRSVTVRDGDGGRKTTNMTVTTAPDGTNSYTQVGATSTRYADNGSADGNGSKPEQATDNTGDIENEINRDFRDPVRNALGAAAAAAQAAHDFADPCMGAKTSAGCGGAIALQAMIGPVLTRDIKGLKVYTDKAGAELIDNGGSYLYRGVHKGHPAEVPARDGIVVPGNPYNSSITPSDHNLGDVRNSSYTAWSRREDVARANAGTDGVILRVRTGAPPEGADWSWQTSPDNFEEGEVLLRGIREGVEVLP
jgi:hypothetical protein